MNKPETNGTNGSIKIPTKYIIWILGGSVLGGQGSNIIGKVLGGDEYVKKTDYRFEQLQDSSILDKRLGNIEKGVEDINEFIKTTQAKPTKKK